MSNATGNTNRWGEDESGKDDVDREIGVLLEKLGNWGFGTLLNRLKKGGKINHDEINKKYCLPTDNNQMAGAEAPVLNGS